MRRLSRWQRGQGMPEYAMILAAVALVSIVVLGLLGLALSRQYGLVAGVLGTRKDVQTSPNHVYFDTNPPQCGIDNSPAGDGKVHLFMQFFTDIKPYLTATTENPNIPMEMVENESPPSGIGNWYIDTTLDANVLCPLAVIIQSDKAHGGVTVVWNVLHQDWH